MDFVSYRCDHGQTILDPNNETQMKLFTSVSPVEWDHLEAYHPYDGFRISIMLDEEAHLMKLVPPFCQVCQERR